MTTMTTKKKKKEKEWKNEEFYCSPGECQFGELLILLVNDSQRRTKRVMERCMTAN